MTSASTMLLIGAGGCLGRAVLALGGDGVLPSSREQTAPFHVDLAAAPDSWRLPDRAGAALLLAARTDTGACERDPDGARAVNVNATLELARRLAQRGCFLVFPSTSQVFDGARAMPAPSDPVCPVTVYGRHKAEVEAALLAEHPGRAAVLRLAKVLDGGNGLIRRWAGMLLRGEPVEAFSDMRMSPVTELAAAKALVDCIGEPGVRHLSAGRDLSYEEAALLGAQTLGVSRSLVRGVSCAGRGLFAPMHTALAMTTPAPDAAEAVQRAFLQAKVELCG